MNVVTGQQQALRGAEFLRQRFHPRFGDRDYLHLSDLRLALGQFESAESLSALDFGSGGAPYRPLFPHARYACADIEAGPGVDFPIGADGAITAPADSFDLVLSTQVLEHVKSPSKYLTECHRICHRGGRLLVTTHGIWEDHPCPEDLWRWTCDGLARIVTEAGFEVRQVKKVTTTGRALVAMLEQQQGQFSSSRRTRPGLAWWLLYRWLLNRPAFLHRWADAHFSNCRIVDAKEPGHGIYLGILIEAGKP